MNLALSPCFSVLSGVDVVNQSTISGGCVDISLFVPMTSCGGGACLRRASFRISALVQWWVTECEGVWCRSSYIARTVMSEMQFQDYTSITTL